MQGNLNEPRYETNVRESVVVPYFDIHALVTRPVCMDDNARDHRTRAVMDFLQRNAITTFLGRHEAPTSIQLRTCGAVWVDMYVRDIL